MMKYAVAGFLACTAITSAASAATLLPATGTTLDEMIFSQGTQTSSTILGVTKITDTSITFYSSTSVLSITGQGYAQIDDSDTDVTPWQTLEVFRTDGGGFTAYEFTAMFSSAVTPSQLTIGYDLLSGGPTIWKSPLDFPNDGAKDYQLLAEGSEVFTRVYFSSNDPIFQIKQNDITLSSAIPEPNSWGMLIAGFGLVGYSLRKARRAGKLASA